MLNFSLSTFQISLSNSSGGEYWSVSSQSRGWNGFSNNKDRWNVILCHPSFHCSNHPSIIRFPDKKKAAIQQRSSSSYLLINSTKKKNYSKIFTFETLSSPSRIRLKHLEKANNIFLYFNFRKKKTKKKGQGKIAAGLLPPLTFFSF